MNNNQSNSSNSDRGSEPSSSSIGIDLDEGENYFYIDDKGEKVPVNIDELRDLESGEEFLLYYARHGEALMVNRLCNTKKIGQLELNINCKGKKKFNHGWTPLHLASYFGHYEVVKVLLENGAQVNVINDDGDTPLHKAAYVGRLDIVVLLLAHGANLFTKNAKGKTPQDLSQSTEIIDALLAAEATDMRRKEDRFLRAARDGELDVVKELLNDINPVEINCKDSSGNNALHWAAYRNHKEIVVYLLQNGIDSTVKNNQDQTPALMASNVQTKQLISDVQPISFNVNMKSLAKCMISRFEGPLLRRSRLLVRKCLWIVLERGVLSFYSNRADASSGIKRKGYKFLECAHVEASSKDETSFIIYFNDNSRCTLSTIPSNKISAASIIQLDRQKWMSAIKDHIDYATKFFRSGLRVDFENAGALGQSNNGRDSTNSKDEEDVLEFLSAPSLQPYINNAQAHVTILQKHIKAMMQLVEESSQILRADTLELSGTDTVEFQRFRRDLTMEWKNFWPSVKFHFNIILKAGDHTSAALSDCLTILSQQDQLRQLLSQRDQEKIRVLEQSLKVLTREHRRSSLLNSSSSMSPQRLSCKGHLSDTDLDEYYDALEDSDDDFNDSISQKTLESLGKTLTNGDHLAKNSSGSSERKDSLTETSLFKSTKDLFSMLPN